MIYVLAYFYMLIGFTCVMYILQPRYLGEDIFELDWLEFEAFLVFSLLMPVFLIWSIIEVVCWVKEQREIVKYKVLQELIG